MMEDLFWGRRKTLDKNYWKTSITGLRIWGWLCGGSSGLSGYRNSRSCIGEIWQAFVQGGTALKPLCRNDERGLCKEAPSPKGPTRGLGFGLHLVERRATYPPYGFSVAGYCSNWWSPWSKATASCFACWLSRFHQYNLLQIEEPKTRFKAARHQVARLDQPALLIMEKSNIPLQTTPPPPQINFDPE